jgi:hypothetical protein
MSFLGPQQVEEVTEYCRVSNIFFSEWVDMGIKFYADFKNAPNK